MTTIDPTLLAVVFVAWTLGWSGGGFLLGFLFGQCAPREHCCKNAPQLWEARYSDAPGSGLTEEERKRIFGE